MTNNNKGNLGKRIVGGILRQYNTGAWWGGFKSVAQNVMSYVILLNLILVAPMAYSTTVDPWLSQRGIQMPLFVFMGLIMLGIVFIFVVEYKVSLPSVFHFTNTQWWEHKNPMRKEMIGQKKRLKGMEKELAELKSMIGELVNNAKQDNRD